MFHQMFSNDKYSKYMIFRYQNVQASPSCANFHFSFLKLDVGAKYQKKSVSLYNLDFSSLTKAHNLFDYNI